MHELIVFGPQRLEPVLRPQLDRLGVGEPVASITAGWQEREGEIEDMTDHLQRQVVDLELHRRTEVVWEEDPDLFHAHRARQDRLQALQRLYRLRLDYALEPARRLLRREDAFDPKMLEATRESAIGAVRLLDDEHLQRVRAEHERFESQWHPTTRDAVAAQRDELTAILSRSDALAIAGGHVAVLLNRMRLFGFAELIADFIAEKPVFAWAAGAMALSSRIVLFHDSPPQGAGNPEVLDAGLGCYRGLVPLPAAGGRLRLDDTVRVSLFARRFAPDVCLPLDAGMSARRVNGSWLSGERSTYLAEDGRVEDWKAMAA
ncbi:MAG: hypothetical protein MPN21_00350 [Thermoanaerobaculia bacterium]|nr:hypothetical protein [Thermoanaerobaculia bacterium]